MCSLLALPLALEHGGNIITSWLVHQTAALEIGHRRNAGAAWYQYDGGGVLKDHAEDDIVGAFGAVDDNAGRAHAEVGSAFGHLKARIDARAALANLDIKTIVAIETLLDRSVIASELELVFPLQLQRHLFEA